MEGGGVGGGGSGGGRFSVMLTGLEEALSAVFIYVCPGALAGLDVEVFRVTPVAAGAILYCREYRGKPHRRFSVGALSAVRGGTLPVCGGDLVVYARGRRSLRDGWFASVVQVAVQVTADGERVRRLSGSQAKGREFPIGWRFF